MCVCVCGGGGVVCFLFVGDCVRVCVCAAFFCLFVCLFVCVYLSVCLSDYVSPTQVGSPDITKVIAVFVFQVFFSF